MRPAIVALLLVLLTACAPQSSPDVGGGPAAAQLPAEMLAPRSQYDTSRPFLELVKPHFYARSTRGDLAEYVRPQEPPDRIVEHEGKIKLRFSERGRTRYMDLLTLESEQLGEHPVHKVYRLRAMGVPMEGGLARRLRPSGEGLREERFPQQLFQTIQFQYLAGKEASGVIAEVFPDGTFLVIPLALPEEWRSDDPGVVSPTHFHVNPRALSAGGSSLAQEFETTILALPFDDQRYPPAPLARQECQVYQESLQHAEYRRLLDEAGYRFSPAHLAPPGGEGPRSFGEELTAWLRGGAGRDVQYFGFEGEWVTDRLVELNVPWIGLCDIAGGVRRYRMPGQGQDHFYFIVRRSLEADKKQRYKIVKLGADGSGQELYTAPGIMLMALPLPSDDTRWLISSEGWPGPAEGVAADPRWQSVYLVNVGDPTEYVEVAYPLADYPKAPLEGLYGASASLSADGRFLFNTLYGFKDEGGGLWVVDLTREDFATDPAAYARIVEWDHALSWTVLERQADGDASNLAVFLTGKEVADDFAMTANLLRLRSDGLDSKAEHRERLRRMVGWNPVPFGWQKIGEHRFLVAVETYFDYESSLLPRAMGVYLVPVDTGLGKN